MNPVFRCSVFRWLLYLDLHHLQEGMKFAFQISSLINFYLISVDVGNLNRALFSHGEQTLANEIQTNFSLLLEEIFAHESKIWLDSSVLEEAGEDLKFGPEATIEDIVKNNSQPKPVLPPYHLLGNIDFQRNLID